MECHDVTAGGVAENVSVGGRGLCIVFIILIFSTFFLKGLYTVGVGGAGDGHSVTSHIDTCTDDDDDDDMFM